MLKIGKKAPDFKLKDKDGRVHSLKSVKSDFTVIYFYPKDDTPGCTIEAKEFSAALPRFKKAKAGILGISGGDERTKAHFCKKYKLAIPLLSDTDYRVAKAFGAFGPKTFMGKKFKGILRNTYVVDRHGKIVGAFEKVTPENHADEILEFLASIRAVPTKAKSSAARKTPAVGKPKGKSSKRKPARIRRAKRG